MKSSAISQSLLTVLVFLFFAVAGEVYSAPVDITLVYTNSLNGNLDYCKCRTNPRGGLVKRATAIRNIRKNFPNVVLVETGDFFTYDPDPLSAKYISEAMRSIAYDAVAAGDQEFTIGADKFLEYAPKLPFVSNNLLVKAGGKFREWAPRIRMVERGGVKIGIIGSVAANAFQYYQSKITRDIKVADQYSEIRKDVKSLKSRGAGLVVLLSHSGYDDDLLLQKKIAGIDIIVGGHTQSLIDKPVMSNGSIIVQAGTNGSRIGILQVKYENGRIVSYKNSFELPDEFRPEDDAYIRRLISDYKKEVSESAGKVRFK